MAYLVGMESYRDYAPRLGISLVILCTLVTLLAAGLALGFYRDVPTWTQTTFASLLIANGATALLLWIRQWRWEKYTGAVVTVVGIYNIIAWDLLDAFSYLGGEFHPGRAVFYIVVPGLLMGAIGIWFLDGIIYRRLTNEVVSVIGVAIVTIGIIIAIYVTVGFTLIPLLWVQGTGLYLSPIALIGGVRWAKGSRTLGNVTIGILVVGILILLATPLWSQDSVGTLAQPQCWSDLWSASLAHSVVWETLEFSWSDGCTSRSLRPPLTPTLAGLILMIIGLARTLITS